MLAEALDTVRHQNYAGRIRTTVVYDCPLFPEDAVSADDGEHRSVRLALSTRPPGLAGARNAGIAMATADLVAFLDDDDLWLPGKIAQQVALITRTGAPLVATGIEVLHGSATGIRRPGPVGPVCRDDLLRDRLAELHPSSFLVRREALELVGGLDEDLPGAYGEDYDLLLRLTVLGDLHVVAEPLTQVRWNGGSYFFSRWQTIADALRYLLVKHPDFASRPAGWARVQGQIAFAEAAMGRRGAAFAAALAASRRNPLEVRAALATLIALHLISADRVQHELHRRGHGV